MEEILVILNQYSKLNAIQTHKILNITNKFLLFQ